MGGVHKLVEHGFLPIITAARTWPESEDRQMVGSFVEMLKRRGYERPRLKILPALLIGAEENRSRGYSCDERITAEMMEGFDAGKLVCEHSRMVTDRGVFVCPILIESLDARLGETLSEAAGRDFALSHGACYTCWQYGSICANPSSAGGFVES
jgi:hypothetical protein